MEDVSLDEFLDAGEDPATSGNTGLAVATLEWVPEGAGCEACGNEVRRRWNGAAGLVCAACKEW